MYNRILLLADQADGNSLKGQKTDACVRSALVGNEVERMQGPQHVPVVRGEIFLK